MRIRLIKSDIMLLNVLNCYRLNNGKLAFDIRQRTLQTVRNSSNLRNYVAENEPILEFKKGSKEREELLRTLKNMNNVNNIKSVTQALFEVPIVIGDKEIRTNNVKYQHVPYDHGTRLARFYHADKQLIKEAIENSLLTRPAWENSSFDFRASILLKAAEKLSTIKRSEILATTMLGQAKTVYQAEIDAACELIDFLRFNVQFLYEALKYKPLDVSTHTINNMELRGLEGFVAAIAPFNFTAIGGNLATCPALMGNVVIWKPSDTAILSSYVFYKILRECGLPPGVINFIPADGPEFGEAITTSPDLAAINFTGSVPTFRWLWKSVGQNLEKYKTFPRLSGECGGKNFHLIHESADLDSACVATIRSAYEYSGQKCSACSRLYVPKSKWPQMREKLKLLVSDLKVDVATNFEAFTSSVIDEKSFDRIANYIDYGKKNANNTRLIFGGTYDKSKGYFIKPTLFETSDPYDRLMKEEIFGPVLTAFVYNESEYDKVVDLIDRSTPYALTGAIFAQDKNVLESTKIRLRHSCGNMYINDKSTGAVVNQQPFGGARLSGTNDKPGGPHYIFKWTSPLSVKKYLLPQTSVKHTSMI